MLSRIRSALGSHLRLVLRPAPRNEKEALLDHFIEAAKIVGAKTPRQAAEIAQGRQLTDEEWGKHADDWNQRWY